MNSPMEGHTVIGTNTPPYAEPMEWTNERPAEWHEPPVLSLDEHGVIQDCSKSCERLFGYPCRDLFLQHVATLFPQLSGVAFVQGGRFTPLLEFFCHCGYIFQAHNRLGETFSSKLSFVRLGYDGKRTLRLIVTPLGKVEA
jgi:PAS domain-containing protein